MRILFISTLNLATNPRLFKEIQLALQAGYEVDVLCFEFNNWSFEFNRQLKKKLGEAELTTIEGGRKPFFPWLFSVFQEKLFRTASKIIPVAGGLLSQAVSRRSNLLISRIKKMDGKYDLVIGHNPGALYPAYLAGKKLQCKVGFDIEDYHPGEGTNKHGQALTKKLIGHYLHKMDYVTFAAPLMRKRTIEDIGHAGKNWNDILNFFPRNEFSYEKKEADNILKVVWFSQNVNYNRGLEQVIPILEKFQDKIELTLIGNKKEPFFTNYVANHPWIKHLPPMSQKDLHKAVTNFDIGLAIEPGKDHNNMIALANKLITYFQSGLYILASDTPSHIDFFSLYPEHGMATNLSEENMELVFTKLFQQKNLIRDNREKRIYQVKEKGWETESQKLLQIWKQLLN